MLPDGYGTGRPRRFGRAPPASQPLRSGTLPLGGGSGRLPVAGVRQPNQHEVYPQGITRAYSAPAIQRQKSVN